MLLHLCAIVLVSSLVLGGGTRGGFLSDAILQILSIPLLLLACWRAWVTPLARQTRRALGFCCVIAVIPLVQLMPLPPWLWTALPNREISAAAYQLVEGAVPWMPVSVAPTATWLAATSLIPPLAIFVSSSLLDLRQRRVMSLVVIGVGIVSAFLGLLQVAQGPSSSLRFFEFTNLTEAVGFFANRNHFAALLVAALMFASAWAVNSAAEVGPRLKQYDIRAIVLLVGTFTVLTILLSGQVIARSRAGLGLTIIALFGAFLLAASDRRATQGVTPAKLLIGATTLVVIFATQYALYRIFERFDADLIEDARVGFARNTLAAAWAYMPFGSGLGSFATVYGLFENPQDALANMFANRAHNDVLELWLETGIIGLILMVIFSIWFGYRSWEVWRTTPKHEAMLDRLLARAATLVIALLVAHSFVDYPLRTGAMIAIVALACALLIDPPIDSERAITSEETESKEQARPQSVAAAMAVTRSAPADSSRLAPKPRPPAERWGKTVDWPEAWRSPADRRAPQDDTTAPPFPQTPRGRSH